MILLAFVAGVITGGVFGILGVASFVAGRNSEYMEGNGEHYNEGGRGNHDLHL